MLAQQITPVEAVRLATEGVAIGMIIPAEQPPHTWTVYKVATIAEHFKNCQFFAIKNNDQSHDVSEPGQNCVMPETACKDNAETDVHINGTNDKRNGYNFEEQNGKHTTCDTDQPDNLGDVDGAIPEKHADGPEPVIVKGGHNKKTKRNSSISPIDETSEKNAVADDASITLPTANQESLEHTDKATDPQTVLTDSQDVPQTQAADPTTVEAAGHSAVQSGKRRSRYNRSENVDYARLFSLLKAGYSHKQISVAMNI